MYIYKELVTDDSCKEKKNKILRKIRMNAGLVDIYVICLAKNSDTFDIINCANLKQKLYPKKELMILGIAEGKDSAVELAAQLFVSLSAFYGMTEFKKELIAGTDTLFRRY